MQTQFLTADQPKAIEQAATLLKQGQIVIFPTDTLYGIGVNAYNPSAIDQLYEAKERSLDKGIPILIGDWEMAEKVATNIPRLAYAAMTRFWPGPLTVILPKHPSLPANIAPTDTVAVRLPNHWLTRQLIRLAGGAVAASSANLSGQAPAGTAQEAFDIFSGRVAAVFDGGPVSYGVASTILDCTVSPPQIVRPGPIARQLHYLIGP